MGSAEMKHILFDQYQRYNNVTKIINGIRQANQKFKILEVGANEHRNLEGFLPDDTITYLDIQLPDYLKDDPQYVLGDATAMEFKENEFDIVVALDVFEHIPGLKRNDFIDEIYRVASQCFILTAPFDSPKVIEAESRANAVYKGLFHKDFIWLEEHTMNGLPKSELVENYLQYRGIDYKMISHGAVDIWEKLMTIHFIAASNPGLAVYREEIDKFYNTHMFEEDYVHESYRKIFMGHKNKNIIWGLPERENEKIPQFVMDKFNELEQTFYKMLIALPKKEVQLQESVFPIDRIQIYIDSGNGFNEVESLVVEINEKLTLSHASFDLSDYETIHAIRIDPSDYKGMYKLDNIMIKDKNDCYVFNYRTDGNYLFFYNDFYLFSEDDPSIVLEFDTKLSLKTLRFDVQRALEDSDFIINEIGKIILENNKVTEQLKIKENAALIEQDKYKILLDTNILLNDQIDKEKADIRILEEKNDIIYEQNRILQEENIALKEQNLSIESERQLAITKLENIYNSKVWKLTTMIKRVLGK
ncbi:class I SAM-dependent methyltransferase [Paenibacillus jamilae]|uniref:class I SAM-dependent methyltransferase n=1 Tax=Paenibacillus jamilae TaxID=114136 RepID=UPI0009EF027E|nr:class I SAM-dependent methyltransferase [Paenibacillus jamilae]